MSMDRWMGEWSYYNYALEVFTQRNFVADFERLKWNFIPKTNKKTLFEPLFGGLRDNVRIP